MQSYVCECAHMYARSYMFLLCFFMNMVINVPVVCVRVFMRCMFVKRFESLKAPYKFPIIFLYTQVPTCTFITHPHPTLLVERRVS